jgi:hypothetical protein
MPGEFDEESYLEANPDVAAADAAGHVSSGAQHYEIFGQREGRQLRRRKSYVFYIDVFSYCNLRCPSCAVGIKYGDIAAWPKGIMSPHLLEQILEKALGECNIGMIGLYNWTEPLLHPDIASLVRVIKSAHLRCVLSSNLNVLREPDRLLAENPDVLRISLSGFTQDIYQRGHRKGNIDKVKENMSRLAQARDAVGSSTKIHVFYHKYVYNLHEQEKWRILLPLSGLDSTAAYFTLVEKIIDVARGNKTPEDIDVLDQLIHPIEQALAITSRTKKDKCNLIEDVLTLDVEGNVMLCCGSSMELKNQIGNFLALPLEEIQRLRRSMSLCGPCLDLGIPDYFAGGNPEFAKIARAV